jgi:hypothetical protein
MLYSAHTDGPRLPMANRITTSASSPRSTCTCGGGCSRGGPYTRTTNPSSRMSWAFENISQRLGFAKSGAASGYGKGDLSAFVIPSPPGWWSAAGKPSWIPAFAGMTSGRVTARTTRDPRPVTFRAFVSFVPFVTIAVGLQGCFARRWRACNDSAGQAASDQQPAAITCPTPTAGSPASPTP